MPEKLKRLLDTLTNAEGDLIAQWFDGDPEAVHECIACIIDARPALHESWNWRGGKGVKKERTT